jgi:PIN domain nuclease of toxin-antitoxin system
MAAGVAAQWRRGGWPAEGMVVVMGARVLDASALLAWLYDEPGAGVVDAVLDAAAISTAGLGEVLAVVAAGGADPAVIADDLGRLGLDAIDLGAEDAASIPAIVTTAMQAGVALSLGESAAIALARTLGGVPVLTTEAAWKRLEVGVPIVVVGDLDPAATPADR